jgi:hypothetical protein
MIQSANSGSRVMILMVVLAIDGFLCGFDLPLTRDGVFTRKAPSLRRSIHSDKLTYSALDPPSDL